MTSPPSTSATGYGTPRAQPEPRQHGDGEEQEDEELDLGHGIIEAVCVVDARGLRCPLPLVRARQALASLAPGETLVVLATDPEAPIDLAALAADVGRAFAAGARRRRVAADASRRGVRAARRRCAG